MGREAAVSIHQVLVEQFIASFAEPPEELILDFDATDDRVHGLQKGRFFHGLLRWPIAFCPCTSFAVISLLVSYLRPSKKIDGAKHAWDDPGLVGQAAATDLAQPVADHSAGPTLASAVHRMLRWCERPRCELYRRPGRQSAATAIDRGRLCQG